MNYNLQLWKTANKTSKNRSHDDLEFAVQVESQEIPRDKEEIEILYNSNIYSAKVYLISHTLMPTNENSNTNINYKSQAYVRAKITKVQNINK